MTVGGMPVPGRARPPDHRQESTNLADILERVLDKGIVIAGDIRVNLLDIELLTIKIRLLVASVDKAREMGIDWWEHDPTLSSGQRDLAEENRRLRERVGALEAARDGDGNNSSRRVVHDRDETRAAAQRAPEQHRLGLPWPRAKTGHPHRQRAAGIDQAVVNTLAVPIERLAGALGQAVELAFQVTIQTGPAKQDVSF